MEEARRKGRHEFDSAMTEQSVQSEVQAQHAPEHNSGDVLGNMVTEQKQGYGEKVRY